MINNHAPVLLPEKVTFCLLSLCGPNANVQADSCLATTLARRGFETRWLFMDPCASPRMEKWQNGRLTLHRWNPQAKPLSLNGDPIQEIPRHKAQAFNAFAPAFIMDFSVRPAITNGRLPVIIGQGWHTAGALLRLHRNLETEEARQRCALLWQINHHEGDYTKQIPMIEATDTILVHHHSTPTSNQFNQVEAVVRLAMTTPESGPPKPTNLMEPRGS